MINQNEVCLDNKNEDQNQNKNIEISEKEEVKKVEFRGKVI